jgi:hypothetical protein
MPIHDWTRVDAGTFHAFHTLWIGRLMESLNTGLLPTGYYALAEQVATRMQTDVLALETGSARRFPAGDDRNGGLAVAEAPPLVRLRVRPDPQRKKPRRPTSLRRHVAIRHITGHRVVALIEVVSPANKDRKSNVRELAEKVVRTLESGVHVLVLDLLPGGRHDPKGIHGAVWAYFDSTACQPPDDAPLMLASYAWDGSEPDAFLEPTARGHTLIEMPLFLTPERYINVPLETTYTAAYRGMPEFWRDVLDRAEPPD